MAWKLKKGQPDFSPVAGKFANKEFMAGVTYDAIPEEEKHRFEEVKKPIEVKSKKKGGDK